MKPLTLCFLLAVFAHYNHYSQINTIGPFAPGKTTINVVDSIATAHDVAIKKTADVLEVSSTTLNGKTEKIHEILHSCEHNNEVAYSYGNPIHEDHTMYQIDYLTVSELLFSEIELHFWKDTLYYVKFNINGDKFRNAIRQKYGAAIIDSSKTNRKNIQCNDMGNTLTLEETSTSTYFKTPKTLSAWTTHSKYYNTECEAVYSEYFVILNIKTDEQVVDLEKKIEDAHRAAK